MFSKAIALIIWKCARSELFIYYRVQNTSDKTLKKIKNTRSNEAKTRDGSYNKQTKKHLSLPRGARRQINQQIRV